jgi:hypothetical protein
MQGPNLGENIVSLSALAELSGIDKVLLWSFLP